MIRTIEVRENINHQNDCEAEALRKRLTEKGTVMLNVMSSPGSGKTTLLTELIRRLKGKLKLAVMDVDIETDLDAERIARNTGIESIQIHNGGLCHIDAGMTAEAIEKSGIDISGIDLIFLENIGNLVCPAEFDTGSHKNIMLLSVPEGDDKPLKYPLMFTMCDLIVITKLDTLPVFDFNIPLCKKYIYRLNPEAKILEVSAKTGAGMTSLTEEILKMADLNK